MQRGVNNTVQRKFFDNFYSLEEKLKFVRERDKHGTVDKKDERLAGSRRLLPMRNIYYEKTNPLWHVPFSKEPLTD